MPSDVARLAIVQQCIEQVWIDRVPGEWTALERAIIAVLAPRADRRVAQRRTNVILLADHLERRLKDRRRGLLANGRLPAPQAVGRSKDKGDTE